MEIKRISINNGYLDSYLLDLGSKNLIILKGSRGYIMCGYLSIEAANKFNDVAIKVTGVSTVEELLNSSSDEVSEKAEELGIKKGQSVRDIAEKIV